MWLAYVLFAVFCSSGTYVYKLKWVRDEEVNNVEHSAREKKLFEVQKKLLWGWTYGWINTTTNEDVHNVGVEYLHQDKKEVWEKYFRNAKSGWKMYISMSWMTKQLSDVRRPKFTVTNEEVCEIENSGWWKKFENFYRNNEEDLDTDV